MTADEDTRQAVIAGLIDSDGSYRKSHNNYICPNDQRTQKDYVRPKEFYVTLRNIEMRKNVLENSRKHLPSISPKDESGMDHDTRPFTISDEFTGEYREISCYSDVVSLASCMSDIIQHERLLRRRCIQIAGQTTSYSNDHLAAIARSPPVTLATTTGANKECDAQVHDKYFYYCCAAKSRVVGNGC
ncbi:hypothetical protein V1525DRAFT_421972 [Lipomyces kononenkoae]|uniref:Uncharacterized protein n=1 Tax=Lipomyces kononenkoae TaxID=34357 RepID=A0ACC3STL2_LIPKO